jgi:hypothetical protein
MPPIVAPTEIPAIVFVGSFWALWGVAVVGAVEVAGFVEYGGVPCIAEPVFDALNVEVVVPVSVILDVEVELFVADCVEEVGPLVTLK